MATIKYNNLDLPENLITFTDVPNILKVTDSGLGRAAEMTFQFIGDLASATSGNSQWYISFLGETITNVLNPNNAINRNFYISSSNVSTAASVARALRNCPTVAANFTIQHDTNMVIMTAKSIGTIWTGNSDYLDYNISSTYFTAVGTDGYASSPLFGSKIDVDVYTYGDYVTTLEKNFYNDEVSFNMSPVITTFAEAGGLTPYTFRISSIVDGNYQLLGNVDTNYATVGYMCNQGKKYLELAYEDVVLAQNVSRGGDNRGYTNNTILYTYAPNIRVSYYKNMASRPYVVVRYKDSAFNLISNTSSTTWPRTNNDYWLQDLTIDLDTEYFNQAFYIEVEINGDIELCYKVIKPIKATEYYQRVFWRNSYGGVSFFDFTGQKTEARDVTTETYEKNIFGYYTDKLENKPLNELEKAYNNEVKYTVTLKSHLMENDGKYIFNDLIQSSNVWTYVNGEYYTIIVDSLSVDETDNNNVFEATLKYHYSLEPSLI